jgi:hypothetical protein
MDEAVNLTLGRVEMLRQGIIVPLPKAYVTAGRDFPDAAVFVARVPMVAGSGDGSRELQAGDILSAAECEHSRGALRSMCLRGEVVELPSATGICALVSALRARCRALERLVVDAALDPPGGFEADPVIGDAA